MNLKVIALYPFWSDLVAAHPGVKTRIRRKSKWVQVTCEVVPREARHVAHPQWTAPAEAPPPVFRFHLEIDAVDREQRKSVTLVLQIPKTGDVSDPEQRILAPIFNSRSKLVYEFERAEVMYVTKEGFVEVRELVLDPVGGDVGTRSKYVFHGRYAKLAARCNGHLSGQADLYPQPLPTKREGIPVPPGAPNLKWGKA